MWRKARPVVLAVSIALNVALLSSWALHAIPAHLHERHAAGGGGRSDTGCPLHRELEVTKEQWREIKPRLAEFQKAAQAICEEVNRTRREMIDLIAAPEPDRQAIRAKQEEILNAQRRMQKLVIEHLLNEKEILGPKQKQRLFQMMRSRPGCAGRGPLKRGAHGRSSRGPAHPTDAGDESAAKRKPE